MRVAIVGGKLQGVEASYLAKKAGWDVVLIDKEPLVPAVGLCDIFYNLDVNRILSFKSVLKDIDLVIPALENREALDTISRVAAHLSVPVIYDNASYEISSCKLKSNNLFADLNIPYPEPWPGCGFPVIAKPSGASGSEGVVRIKNYDEFLGFATSPGSKNDWVIEEYLEGPSYSIEVLGYAGNYKVLQITELMMDADYDCKRVLAPVFIDTGLRKKFEDIALTIARNLNLNGIMDVETIVHQGNLKVLEIDARLPSQTPITVFHSTGVNMLEILGKAFVSGEFVDSAKINEIRGVVFEHLKVTGDRMEVSGEHIMARTGPLRLHPALFGADEVITDYEPNKTDWVATMIIKGANRFNAWEKRCEIIARMCEELKINEFFDPVPAPEGLNNNGRGMGGCYDEIA